MSFVWVLLNKDCEFIFLILNLVNVLKYNERGYRRIVGILDQKGNEMNDLLSLIDRKKIIDENIIRNEFNLYRGLQLSHMNRDIVSFSG